MTLPIKLIKLSNGDSLVAKIDVNEDKEYATIKQPVRIHRWMSPAGPEAGGAYENATFGPWESFSDDQIFHIAKREIITLTEPRKDVKIYYTKLLDRLKNTPVEKMNEPASLEEEMKDEEERRALHLKRLQNMVDNMNETLGLNDTDKEEVFEYLYNKEKVTIH